MSNDLVVQLGAKLDQFQSDMNSAGDMADSAVSRIESSFAGLNPSAGGFAALFTGASAGIAGIIAYVVSLNKELADMQTTAEQVGLTLKDFQGIQFGGQVAGLSTDQINTGLEKSASLLNDASRNSNTLSKELDANGLSVKNANGQLISQNQLLATAANLVSNAANPQDAIKIAEMLGFTKEWVPLLQQGAAAMGALGDQAQSAGAIIDDATIKKATDFSAAWQKSSVEWATYMKAAIADLLPGMDDLITRAANFLKQVQNNGGGAQGILASLGPSLTVGSGDNKRVVTIDADSLNKATEEFKNAPVFSGAYWASLGAIFGASIKLTPITQAGAGADALNSSGYPQSGPTSIGEVRANLADPTQKNALDAAADSGSRTKIPAKDVSGGADPIKAAIDSLNKHTLATQADADAVGKGAAALAVFKAQAQETAAVAKNGGAETAAQAAQFKVLEAAAGAAALALAKAQIADTISRGQQTAFLDPQDVAIANQLKNIYPDVATAMKSPEAEALRLNQAISGASSAISNDLTTGLTDIASGAKTASQAFHDMGTSILKDIEQMVIKLLIVQPLMQGLQGGAGGIFSFLGLGGTNAIAAGGVVPGAVGATSVGGAALHFAAGTDNAPGGMSLVGENGPEILNIPRGAQVIPNDVLRSKGGGASQTVQYNIDASGADSGTVARIQSVLVAHARAIGAQGNAMTTSQRFQSTGVG